MHPFLAMASCHRHSTLTSQTCEGLHQLWALPRHFCFRLMPHVTSTPPWLLRPVRSPAALSSTLTLSFFWMHRHPVFQFAHMWVTGRYTTPEVTHINSLTCDLRDAIPRQRSPTLIPREAEDFPRGFNHSKHVTLPTYLAWLKPIYHNSRYAFIHVKTNFACDEDINKKT